MAKPKFRFRITQGRHRIDGVLYTAADRDVIETDIDLAKSFPNGRFVRLKAGEAADPDEDVMTDEELAEAESEDESGLGTVPVKSKASAKKAAPAKKASAKKASASVDASDDDDSEDVTDTFPNAGVNGLIVKHIDRPMKDGGGYFIFDDDIAVNESGLSKDHVNTTIASHVA